MNPLSRRRLLGAALSVPIAAAVPACIAAAEPFDDPLKGSFYLTVMPGGRPADYVGDTLLMGGVTYKMTRAPKEPGLADGMVWRFNR